MKYTPSALLGQLSGSQGSTVASHNQWGSYLRGRVIPVNPNTTVQAAQRNGMALLAELWRTLTTPQKQGWQSLGLLITKTDSLGNSYTLNGFAAFMSLNRNRSQFGLVALLAAPAITAGSWLTSVGAITADSVGLTFSVPWLPTPVPANKYLLIEATRALSPGETYVGRSQYRIMRSIGPATASPQSIYTQYTDRFGLLAAGSKIALRLRAFDVSGQEGASLYGSVIVT